MGSVSMKVVINALQYKQESSGIGILLRELFGAYTEAADRPCQVILPRDGPDFPAGPSAEVIRADCAYGQGLRRMLFQTFQLGKKYCKNAVLLTTDSKIPFLLPKNCAVIPVVTDLAVYRLKETYQLSRVVWWRMQYRYMRRRAARFAAISQFTRDELAELLRIPQEKIEVAPCACSPAMKPVTDTKLLAGLREKYGLPRQFVLFVGNFNPRKNLERLMMSFDLAKERGLPHALVIAGGQGWKFDRDEALKGIKYREDVRFIGYVPDEDMPALYSAAELFVFPTLYEGFGIPVLEAQACGTPVLTSDGSALPEVGGEAAVYVNPYSVEDIAGGMLRVLRNRELAAELSRRGLENVKRFSWQSSAEKLSKIIEKTAGEREK